MKREKKTPTKAKTRKISTSSSASTSQSEPEPNVTAATKQEKEDRVLVEECNQSANPNQSNVSIRLKNADMLAKYRNKNPHIQIVNPTTTTNFAADEISDDDEVWIFKVPASIDATKFVGKTIKFGSKKSTIKTDDGEIEYNTTQFEPNGVYQNTLSVAFQNRDGQFSMKNIKPVGQLMFHKKIDNSAEPIEFPTKRGRHECTVFPENLKVRHPLLGFQYQDKVELSKTIKKKLNEAKKASEHSEPSVRIKQEKEDTATKSQTSPKKSKKRKAEEIETIAPKKLKGDIKTENGHDDDLDMIKQIFAKN